MQTDSVKERFRKQREALGLPPKEELAIGSDGMVFSEEMIAEEIKKYDDEVARDADIDIGEDVGGATEHENFMEEKPAKEGKLVL